VLLHHPTTQEILVIGIKLCTAWLVRKISVIEVQVNLAAKKYAIVMCRVTEGDGSGNKETNAWSTELHSEITPLEFHQDHWHCKTESGSYGQLCSVAKMNK